MIVAEKCCFNEIIGSFESEIIHLVYHQYGRPLNLLKTGISFYKVDLKALDKAYSIAFPESTPINVNKKKR